MPCVELNENDQAVWNIGPSDYETVAPGTYVVTYDVGIEGLPATNQQFTVSITLVDPCDSPVSLSPIVLTDQRYTITDVMKSYTHDDVVADPVYCPVRYEYSIEKLANGNEPVTQTVDKQIDIYYTADLTPLDETPLTVTVTAISESRYATTESN